MTKSKYIFEQLARPGECWHTDIATKDVHLFKCPCGFKTADYYTFEFHLENNQNPDFSKPEGFFWLWERAQEKEWWVDFLVKTYGPEYWHSVLNLGYLVHPTRFFDALYDFLKGGRT